MQPSYQCDDWTSPLVEQICVFSGLAKNDDEIKSILCFIIHPSSACFTWEIRHLSIWERERRQGKECRAEWWETSLMKSQTRGNVQDYKEIFQDIFSPPSLSAVYVPRPSTASQLLGLNPENSKHSHQSLPTWPRSHTRRHTSVTDGEREWRSIRHDLGRPTTLLLSLIYFIYCPRGPVQWLPVELLHTLCQIHTPSPPLPLYILLHFFSSLSAGVSRSAICRPSWCQMLPLKF